MSMRWLPPLTALRSFEAVGRLGNVKDAARELYVTAAAVNHQIRGLEQHLGAELFTRTKQGLVLTQQGQEFLQSVSGAFEQLSKSARLLRNQVETKRLVVECLGSFANSFLLPRLPRFHAQHPDIQLEIKTQAKPMGPVNFGELKADLAIRGSCENVWPGMHAEKLLHLQMFPVCAPSLLIGPHPLRKPEDLAFHRLLVVTNIQEGWNRWFRAAEAMGADMSGIDLSNGTRFDQLHMSMIAAVQEMGVDLGFSPFVDRALSRGLLVEPFDIRVTTKMAYWLVCPTANAETEMVQKFSAWLKVELGLADADAPLSDDVPAAELALTEGLSVRAAE